MLKQIRKDLERGTANHGWLKAKHSFSFAGYQDPRFTRFRTLRVINQDAKIYLGIMCKNDTFVHETSPKLGIWIQIVKGKIQVNDNEIGPGDGIAFENESKITIYSRSDAEFLLFELD